ncbi:MAG TPA: alpha/beta fold hydrolase [Steroidobacteraceae bacterium]|nr:alpha/beta fold hydrolase [Steroidobacteraceae bacterium]
MQTSAVETTEGRVAGMVFRPNPDATVRLFCFAYAGGGASMYARWHRFLPAYAEVVSLQLPGRENTFRASVLTDMETVVAECVRVVLNRSNLPFAFFGHSLGGLLGFEIARALQRRRAALPETLYVSGVRAPFLPPRRKPICELSDAEFVAEIRKYNGTPESVLQNRELLPLVLPALRADTTVFDRYRYRRDDRLSCPIVAFGGNNDPFVNMEELTGWEAETSADFRYRVFEGDHFFIHPHERELQQEVSSGLARVLELHDASCAT